MPTTRPRHVVTETDEITRALDQAARRWPQDAGSRSRLLVRLVREGLVHIAEDEDRELRARRARVRRHAGALTGCFPQGYLADLREDWPE